MVAIRVIISNDLSDIRGNMGRITLLVRSDAPANSELSAELKIAETKAQRNRIITAGESYAIYSRIFTPGNKHRLDIKIIDADKKIAAESTIFHQGIGEGFLSLPCQKLNPGHYEVEITLDKNFTEKIKLWINPEIIR